MGNSVSTISVGLQLAKGICSRLLFGWSPLGWQGDPNNDNYSRPIPSYLKDMKLVSELTKIQDQATTAATTGPVAGPLCTENVNKLSNDQLIKISRQLEFWYSENGGNFKNQPNEEMVNLASRLVDQSLWYRKNEIATQVPKVRFGKTELQMPVITCGGMRFQSTWLPDFVPILRPSRKTVLSSPSQTNIKNCLKACLKLGINHFETARIYGTSEYQMVDALYELMQEGEIKRKDFILQTKIVDRDRETFLKYFNQSWANIKEKMEYIDLLAIHGVSLLDDNLKASLAVCEDLKKEGKVRHIGFSTHGTAEQIMDLINTEKFDYVNLHYHYFGSYHGSGTTDTKGGEGNLECVKRALELDMGVFQISPYDKGGKLFRPSKDCALTVGKELTPMEFALVYGLKNGFHTSSVGISRPSDLDEVMTASRTLSLGQKGGVDVDTLLNKTDTMLKIRFEERVGKEWAEKGLLNLPTCYEKETDGIAVGHILWLHNLLTAFGMYEFCKDRYDSLKNTKWDKKKSFEENVGKMPTANAGRSFDESVDLTKALENHYNPELALKKIKETHKWLTSKSEHTDDDLTQMGLQKGYNLTTWTDMPGEIDSTVIKKLFMNILTGGRMGLFSGPGNCVQQEAEQIRMCL